MERKGVKLSPNRGSGLIGVSFGWLRFFLCFIRFRFNKFFSWEIFAWEGIRTIVRTHGWTQVMPGSIWSCFEIVRSCAWRQKKEPRNIWKGKLDSLYVFYLIRKNNKGHIPNIVVIATYVNRKKIKKVVDLYIVMITMYINETAKGETNAKNNHRLQYNYTLE